MIIAPRFIKVKDSSGRDAIVNLAQVKLIKHSESSDHSRQSFIVSGTHGDECLGCAHSVRELWDMIGEALRMDQ